MVNILRWGTETWRYQPMVIALEGAGDRRPTPKEHFQVPLWLAQGFAWRSRESVLLVGSFRECVPMRR